MKKNRLTKLFFLGIAILTLFLLGKTASAKEDTTLLQPVKLNPMLELSGSSGQHTLGQGQLLLPLYGDSKSAWFGALESKVATQSSNGWLVGCGAGYRRIIDEHILGGYLLIDYNSSPTAHHFWTVNPGIERLGKVWDFRVNGYIPLSTKQWVGAKTFGSDIGISDYVSFAYDNNHIYNEYDRQLQTLEETAPGVDAEIGVAVPRISGLKAYLGGYFFAFNKHSNITGGEARLAYKLGNYTTLELRNTYDNARKNTFTFGLKFAFGGVNKKDNSDISARLLDSIEHNIATSANGYATPIVTSYIANDNNVLYRDHIIAIAPATSSQTNTVVTGSGTVDDPYLGLSQDVLTKITVDHPEYNGTVNLYVKSGTYDLTSGFTNGKVTFSGATAGYSVYGRNSDYKLTANGDTRPELDGWFHFENTTGNTIDSIFIKNNAITTAPSQSTALDIVSANDIKLNNSKIQAISNKNNDSLAIKLSSASLINIKDNNTIMATGVQNIFENDGIKSYLSTVKITGNNNNILSESNSLLATGVDLVESNLNIYGTNNTITTNAGFEADGIKIFDAISDPNSIYIASGNTITVDSVLTAVGVSIHGASLEADGITINVGQNSNPTNKAYGIFFSSFKTLSLINSTFNVKATHEQNSWGIFSHTAMSQADQDRLLNNSNNTFNISPNPNNKIGSTIP